LRVWQLTRLLGAFCWPHLACGALTRRWQHGRIEGIVDALPLATPSEATVRALDDISDTVRLVA